MIVTRFVSVLLTGKYTIILEEEVFSHTLTLLRLAQYYYQGESHLDL